jgi:CRISPR-associated exonuclease Cas4
MFAESELLALSGLQHLVYCPRQWALIHVEQQWAENQWTAEGKVLHERADSNEVEVRPGMRIVRGLYIQSLRLGLAGRADVVEFHAAGEKVMQANNALSQLNRLDNEGVALPGVSGRWSPFPVEYKRGKPKIDLSDRVQLCAQALCLEEMLQVGISSGALFYGKTHRRLDVEFDADLRAQTETLAAEMHALYTAGKTPPPVNDARCGQCSLRANCMPGALDRPRRGRGWLDTQLHAHLEEDTE